MKKLKNEFIKKLIYPRLLKFDTPGILINKVYGLFTKIGKLRLVFLFEDVLVELQYLTISKLGSKKTSELCYRIGKDIGHLSLLNAKVKPAKGIFKHLFIKEALQSLTFAGVSAFTKVSINKDLTKIEAKGENNLVCRKTGNPAFFAGLFSGIASSLLNKNIEVEIIKNCALTKIHNCCNLLANKSIPDKYIPDFREINIPNYHLNFPKNLTKIGEFFSLNQLIKFKKLDFFKEKPQYKTHALFISNVTYEMLLHNYKKINQLPLLHQGLKQGAKKLAKNILTPNTKQKQLQEIKSILCAFGWGFPYHQIKDNKITMTFYHHPYSKFGFDAYAYELNGYLNYIFKKELKIESIKSQINPVKTIIVYS